MIDQKAPCGKAASCEECPFPDCEWDGVTAEDWQAAKERDAQARHAAEDGRAAQQRAYREANREKVAAQQRAYREANREKVAAQQRAYREANREKVAAYDRLIEKLVAWREQEKGLTRAVLDDVLELNQKIKREVST